MSSSKYFDKKKDDLVARPLDLKLESSLLFLAMPNIFIPQFSNLLDIRDGLYNL